MLIKLNNTIYNLEKFEKLEVTEGSRNWPDRISFFRHDDEVEWEPYNSLESAQAAFDKIANMIATWYS